MGIQFSPHMLVQFVQTGKLPLKGNAFQGQFLIAYAFGTAALHLCPHAVPQGEDYFILEGGVVGSQTAV